MVFLFQFETKIMINTNYIFNIFGRNYRPKIRAKWFELCINKNEPLVTVVFYSLKKSSIFLSNIRDNLYTNVSEQFFLLSPGDSNLFK